MDLLDPSNTQSNFHDPPQDMEEDDENLLQGSRKRKKVQHKVVCVPIRGDPSKEKGQSPPTDFWAWRKYGQKPIKGSPYPRGYYRCSSSKGCSARKQVERSKRDPSMLIVTYTAEHNHAMGCKPSASSKTSQPKEGILLNNDQEKDDNEGILLLHEDEIPNTMGKPSNESHFSSLMESPSSSEYAFGEEKQVLVDQPSPWLPLEEEGGNLQYVGLQQEEEDVKQDVCLWSSSSRCEGDDFFSDLGMLPELASIFHNKRDGGNLEENDDLSIFGPPPPWSNASPCPLA